MNVAQPITCIRYSNFQEKKKKRLVISSFLLAVKMKEKLERTNPSFSHTLRCNSNNGKGTEN